MPRACVRPQEGPSLWRQSSPPGKEGHKPLIHRSHGSEHSDLSFFPWASMPPVIE